MYCYSFQFANVAAVYVLHYFVQRALNISFPWVGIFKNLWNGKRAAWNGFLKIVLHGIDKIFTFRAGADCQNRLQFIVAFLCKQRRRIWESGVRFNSISIILYVSVINPFHDTDLFLYPMKTSERFPNVFRWYRKRPVAWNVLICHDDTISVYNLT